MTPPQEENRREAVSEMEMRFFGVAGADGCQECHSGWIGRSCTLVDAFGRGCTGKKAQIFLASESHENWGSYQDGVH